MSKVLHIKTSPNFDQSLSRAIGSEFMSHWTMKNPQDEVIVRDLAQNPIPFVDKNWIVATRSPIESLNDDQKKSYALMEELTNEFLSADVYVMEIPLYNLTVPASFKAYIDQIVVAGKTFKYTNEGPVGIVPEGKKVFVIASSGSDYDTLTKYGVNHHEPYIKSILNFIGIKDITFLKASARTDETFQQEVSRVKEELKSALA